MRRRTYLASSIFLSAAGVAFAGYLGATRLTTGVCAFAEPCPFFLGQPACYTGFALFAAMLAVSLVALATRAEGAWPAAINLVVSLFGVVFAGRMTLLELASGARYRLLLPTCAWGLSFFIAMLVVSALAFVGRPRRHQPA